MFIRPATVEDARGCVHAMVEAMSASADYGNPRAEEIFDHWMTRVSGYLAGTYYPGFALDDRAVFVAELSAKIIGMMAGHRTLRFGCDGELQWAFVLPGYQRRGIGKSLLSSLRPWFAEHRIYKVCANAPQEMSTRAFYIKYGAVSMNEHWVIWEKITHA